MSARPTAAQRDMLEAAADSDGVVRRTTRHSWGVITRMRERGWVEADSMHITADGLAAIGRTAIKGSPGGLVEQTAQLEGMVSRTQRQTERLAGWIDSLKGERHGLCLHCLREIHEYVTETGRRWTHVDAVKLSEEEDHNAFPRSGSVAMSAEWDATLARRRVYVVSFKKVYPPSLEFYWAMLGSQMRGQAGDGPRSYGTREYIAWMRKALRWRLLVAARWARAGAILGAEGQLLGQWACESLAGDWRRGAKEWGEQIDRMLAGIESVEAEEAAELRKVATCQAAIFATFHAFDPSGSDGPDGKYAEYEACGRWFDDPIHGLCEVSVDNAAELVACVLASEEGECDLRGAAQLAAGLPARPADPVCLCGVSFAVLAANEEDCKCLGSSVEVAAQALSGELSREERNVAGWHALAFPEETEEGDSPEIEQCGAAPAPNEYGWGCTLPFGHEPADEHFCATSGYGWKAVELPSDGAL